MGKFEEKMEKELNTFIEDSFSGTEWNSPVFAKCLKLVVEKAFRYAYGIGYDNGYYEGEKSITKSEV